MTLDSNFDFDLRPVLTQLHHYMNRRTKGFYKIIDDNSGKEMIMKGKTCDSTSGGGLEMQHDIEVDDGNKINDKLYVEKS
ncbi:hypothetical protein LOK49_LG10G01779 [Camellia lanceoleosa]|uniref:Uncharacterized protein n=1 Tax=Camellia lanceoleosa TaxID=1840588 RepID=A0ACC0GB89_9ERIC|nr:hypothetical protein LOK49_LG10G01779 [Camellia lanceoleosa]